MDEGNGGGWGVGDVDAVAENGFGFGEVLGVCREEGDEGLAGLEVGAEFGVELDAGVGVDGGSGGGSAGAEAVDGPADGGGIEGGEVAGVGGVEGAGGGGVVVLLGVGEDAGVAALRCDDREPGGVGGAALEQVGGEDVGGGESGRGVGEVEQVGGEGEGEGDEVGGEGVSGCPAGCRRTPGLRASCRRSGPEAGPWR